MDSFVLNTDSDLHRRQSIFHLSMENNNNKEKNNKKNMEFIFLVPLDVVLCTLPEKAPLHIVSGLYYYYYLTSIDHTIIDCSY
jgi:hypothetical protein